MADDSVEDVLMEVQPEKDTALDPVQKTLRTNSGGYRQALVDPKSGKFLKKKRAMPETREVTRFMREALNRKLEVGDDGKLTKSSRTLLEQIFYNMASIATNTKSDPKWGQNAIAAADWIMRKAHGTDPKGDAELGALERAGVKIVVLTSPALPDGGELKPREELKPSFDAPFIEGEVIE